MLQALKRRSPILGTARMDREVGAELCCAGAVGVTAEHGERSCRVSRHHVEEHRPHGLTREVRGPLVELGFAFVPAGLDEGGDVGQQDDLAVTAEGFFERRPQRLGSNDRH